MISIEKNNLLNNVDSLVKKFKIYSSGKIKKNIGNNDEKKITEYIFKKTYLKFKDLNYLGFEIKSTKIFNSSMVTLFKIEDFDNTSTYKKIIRNYGYNEPKRFHLIAPINGQKIYGKNSVEIYTFLNYEENKIVVNISLSNENKNDNIDISFDQIKKAMEIEFKKVIIADLNLVYEKESISYEFENIKFLTDMSFSNLLTAMEDGKAFIEIYLNYSDINNDLISTNLSFRMYPQDFIKYSTISK